MKTVAAVLMICLKRVTALHMIYCVHMSLAFLYPYLKRKKQGVKTNDSESLFKILLSAVPQGSSVDSILFNIFFNVSSILITETKLHETYCTCSKIILTLLKILERESEMVIS